MENAFVWVKELWEFLVWLLPSYHHHELTDICVSITWGRYTKVRKPGIFWYWPPITSIYHRAANVQTHSTDPIASTTKDGRQVSAKAMVRYTIDDAIKALIETDDVESAIEDEALAALSEVIGTSTFGELTTHRRDLDKQLTTKMKQHLRRFGVSTDRAHFTDLTNARVQHILGVSPTILEDTEEE